jgi:hypothetical protein
MCDVMCVWCAVCTVCPVCGILFCVKVNAIYFHNFRNEKNAPFTSDFSGVYFGPITGGVFVFFPKRIPRGPFAPIVVPSPHKIFYGFGENCSAILSTESHRYALRIT